MKKVRLGSSELMVSQICLGCMGFGDPGQGMHKWTLDYEETKAIIAYALDKGINFFDTAMAYQGGTSEIYLGRALKELAKREDVVIATKYTPRTVEQIQRGISAEDHINTCLKNSLDRLSTDYIDLYIMHMWDTNTPIEESLRILHATVLSGKVKAIGISNCFAWQLAEANVIAKAQGYTPFSSVQGHYNLIFREEEREMSPYCTSHDVAMTPYSALASGRLSKRPDEKSQRLELDKFARGKYDATKEQDSLIIERVMELADRKAVSMTEISLAWLLSKVTSPVVGATKTSHIDGAVKASQLILSPEECAYLEELYTPHPLVGVMAQHN